MSQQSRAGHVLRGREDEEHGCSWARKVSSSRALDVRTTMGHGDQDDDEKTRRDQKERRGARKKESVAAQSRDQHVFRANASDGGAGGDGKDKIRSREQDRERGQDPLMGLKDPVIERRARSLHLCETRESATEAQRHAS